MSGFFADPPLDPLDEPGLSLVLLNTPPPDVLLLLDDVEEELPLSLSLSLSFSLSLALLLALEKNPASAGVNPGRDDRSHNTSASAAATTTARPNPDIHDHLIAVASFPKEPLLRRGAGEHPSGYIPAGSPVLPLAPRDSRRGPRTGRSTSLLRAPQEPAEVL